MMGKNTFYHEKNELTILQKPITASRRSLAISFFSR
jgi:hypothetical protein